MNKWVALIRKSEIICYQISSYPNNKVSRSEYGDSDTQDMDSLDMFLGE